MYFFRLTIIYYHIMFIIVVFILGSNKRFCFFAGFLLSLPRDESRDVTPCLGEGDDFSFFECPSPFYFY